jgi:ABC-type transport system involved in multi-copper enzyme maturation permease subunit
MLQSIILFPLYIWTFGAAYSMLIVISGAPLISEKVNSGSMLILISKPIRRENILLGKLLGLFLYNLMLSAFSLFVIIWMTIFRYTGNIGHFITLFPFMLSTFIYSMFINAVFSTLTISFSSLFNNPRYVTIILILVVLYTFVAFTLVRLFFVNSDTTFYPVDLGYHLGNFYLGLIEFFGKQLDIGRWMIDFNNFTELVSLILNPEEFRYYRTNYITPEISLLLWVTIALIVFIIGIYRIRKKEIFT